MRHGTVGEKAIRLGLAAVIAVTLAIALACTFEAYRHPTHVARWLSQLQLCR